MQNPKFRAWDKVSKKMVSNAYTIDAWGRCSASVEYFGDVDWHVMQYTGLKDKNGKEIYEGDILACDKAKDGHQHISKVNFGWSPEGFYGFYWDSGYEIRNVDYIDKRYSVIGNIYENPDLLNP